MCGEVYGVVEGTTSIIAKNFCVVIRNQLKPFMIERLTSSSIRKMTYEFEKLQGVSYVFRVGDGNHISITTPPIDSTSYYYQKVFYSTLLQGVFDAKCKFGNYDFGWASCYYDWTLFQKSIIGKKVLKGRFCHTK
jgi:hypothetical protein